MPRSSYFGQAVDTVRAFSPDSQANYASLFYTDASADPFAGQTAGNGKIIFTPEEAADNLNRYDVDWTEGNYGALDDNTLTYGFWTFEQFMDSYFFELRYENGEAFNDDAYYAEAYDAFAAFTPSMEALAANSIELWDDLVSINIEAGARGEVSDIMFGQVYMSPAAGAHAYFPQAEALDDYYGTTEYGLTSGDVMTNWLYPEDFEGSAPGDYGWWAVTHELGHSMGLAHGGDYNASDDNDGDGQPDPITYANDAYYFQDTQQYTMMSYFSATSIGTAWLDFSRGTEVNPGTGQSGYFYFVNAQTPMVHDVMAIQDLYGADMTTRTGNTVYGFNSNAGNVVYDFAQNEVPVITIWDAGGIDTLDLSGYVTNSIIDINEGAFSSAGHGLYEYRADFGIGNWTQAQVDAFAASRGYGDGGRPEDNIAIAYGAEIENAVGGSGHDRITGNALANVLTGNAGNDVISGGRGADTINGGAGIDTADYSSSTAGVSINLVAGKYSGGDAQGDRLTGIENVTGSAFDDKLIGDQGANVLRGGAGNDTINGGGGADQLFGGAGADLFVFKNAGEIAGDAVMDFGAGDILDLSAFDANSNARGDQAFSFLGEAAFTGTAGELRVQTSTGGASLVMGDLNGDGVADFQLAVTHTDTLTIEHFVL